MRTIARPDSVYARLPIGTREDCMPTSICKSAAVRVLQQISSPPLARTVFSSDDQALVAGRMVTVAQPQPYRSPPIGILGKHVHESVVKGWPNSSRVGSLDVVAFGTYTSAVRLPSWPPSPPTTKTQPSRLQVLQCERCRVIAGIDCHSIEQRLNDSHDSSLCFVLWRSARLTLAGPVGVTDCAVSLELLRLCCDWLPPTTMTVLLSSGHAAHWSRWILILGSALHAQVAWSYTSADCSRSCLLSVPPATKIFAPPLDDCNKQMQWSYRAVNIGGRDVHESVTASYSSTLAKVSCFAV